MGGGGWLGVVVVVVVVLGTDDGGMLSLAVSSRNWASRESVRVVGREMFRFRRRLKARSSCLRFAGTVSGESERIVRACLRREVMVSLGSAGGVGSGASGA